METTMCLTIMLHGIVMQHTCDEDIWDVTLMWMEECCQLLKVENNILLVVDGKVYQKYLWCCGFFLRIFVCLHP